MILVFESNCAPKPSAHYMSCDPWIDEIASYDAVVKNIINYTVHGPFKGKTYDE